MFGKQRAVVERETKGWGWERERWKAGGRGEGEGWLQSLCLVTASAAWVCLHPSAADVLGYVCVKTAICLAGILTTITQIWTGTPPGFMSAEWLLSCVWAFGRKCTIMLCANRLSFNQSWIFLLRIIAKRCCAQSLFQLKGRVPCFTTRCQWSELAGELWFSLFGLKCCYFANGHAGRERRRR